MVCARFSRSCRKRSPVERYQCSRDEQHEVLSPVFDVVAQPHATDADKKGHHEHSRPEHAVGEDLDAVDMVYHAPVERKESPDAVAQQAVD